MMDSMLSTPFKDERIALGGLVRVTTSPKSMWNGIATVIYIDRDPQDGTVCVTVRMQTGRAASCIGSFFSDEDIAQIEPVFPDLGE